MFVILLYTLDVFYAKKGVRCFSLSQRINYFSNRRSSVSYSDSIDECNNRGELNFETEYEPAS